MFHSLVQTSDDRIPMLARLALGMVILPHGTQVLLGLTGGSGVDAALGIVPWPALIAEFIGGLALIVGLFGRVAAFAVTMHLIAAVLLQHWSVGFFMNWSGRQPGEGFEFHILAVTLAIVVMIRGSGALSLDRLLTIKRATV
jgi:putative oxidoreductase